MARIFIAGSTDRLGRAAARTLMNEGHEAVLHARSRERAARPFVDQERCFDFEFRLSVCGIQLGAVRGVRVDRGSRPEG